MISQRKRLPDERESRTFKFTIYAAEPHGKIKGYLIVGLYADGSVGEIFCRLDKQGSTVAGFIDAWAIGVSMLLQIGMPLSTIIDKYRGARFEPAGRTEHPQIPFCTSPVDYVARLLAIKFLPSEEPDVSSAR